jgi:glycine/D-amino acid oxidase-like deaminating enzyme
LASYFPHLDPNPVNIARCLYQKSPDGHFYIDKHVNDERIILATGFSGTGFKHAPAVGLILTQLACDEPTCIDIGQFSMRRFDAKAKL